MNLLRTNKPVACGNVNCDNVISFKDPKIVSATVNLPPADPRQFFYCCQRCFDDAMETAKRSPDLREVRITKIGDSPKRYSVFCEVYELKVIQ